jgi:hypothetical protein
MGMFDSFYDPGGREWQTKAFECDLVVWRVGDPFPADGCASFQVEVISSVGSTFDGTYRLLDGYVTVRDCVVAEVPAERDHSLPLIGYFGALVMALTTEGGEQRG